MYGSFARAEAEYYSDRLRERDIEECEWHEGNAKRDCQECEAAHEADMENTMDAMREER